MAQRWQCTKGLKDIGNGLYAWLQPDGGGAGRMPGSFATARKRCASIRCST